MVLYTRFLDKLFSAKFRFILEITMIKVTCGTFFDGFFGTKMAENELFFWSFFAQKWVVLIEYFMGNFERFWRHGSFGFEEMSKSPLRMLIIVAGIMRIRQVKFQVQIGSWLSFFGLEWWPKWQSFYVDNGRMTCRTKWGHQC